MTIRVAVAMLLASLLIGCTDDKHDERLHAAGPNPTREALMQVADVNAGARKFRQCAACHTIGKGAPDTGGPNLYGIFGQGFGQNSVRFSYSTALLNAKGRWDAETLDAWLANPQKTVPGSKMQFGGVPDPLDRADLVAYLRSSSD